MLVFLIKELRKIKKLTLKEMQENTEMSISYLSEIENNKVKNPSLLVMVKIAKVLDVKLDDIYFVEGEIKSMKKALNIYVKAYRINDERTINFSQKVNKYLAENINICQ